MAQERGGAPLSTPWPPLIYSAAMLLAWTLQQAQPFAWGDMMLARLPVAVGFLVFAAGIALDLWAFQTLRRHDTPVLPTKPARVLVVNGPYRFTRNPIYLGNALALLGLGLVLRWSWAVLLVPVAASAVAWLAIGREEDHLAREFGEAWHAYRSRVRRWL